MSDTPTMVSIPVNGSADAAPGPAGVEAAGKAEVKSATATAPAQAGSPTVPAPKTEKPRPHICGECKRSFARLEHLKRHERSHTKEKPFECPECARKFARRDLLLRHQQKLHSTDTTSSRSRTARRESTSNAAAGPARPRKGTASMRPRSKTIGHIDGNALGMMAAAAAAATPLAAPSTRKPNMGARHAHHASLGQLPGSTAFELRPTPPLAGPAVTAPGSAHMLPRLETRGLPMMDASGGLRTAPPLGPYTFEHDLAGFYGGGAGLGSTVNPAQLRLCDSPTSYSMGTPESPYASAYGEGLTAAAAAAGMGRDEAFQLGHGFEDVFPFVDMHEAVVAESSPSAMSTASHGAMSDVMMDGSGVLGQMAHHNWSQTSFLPPAHMTIPGSFAMDIPPATATTHPSLAAMIPPPGTVSPKDLHDQFGPHEACFPATTTTTTTNSNTTGSFPDLGPSVLVGPFMPPHMHAPTVFDPDTPGSSAASMGGGARQRAMSSARADSITETTRQALISSLNISSSPGPDEEHFSIKAERATSTPGEMASVRSADDDDGGLPSTMDLRRYVSAYIANFHPHLPFLHLPTLAFDSVLPDDGRSAARDPWPTTASSVPSLACLILAMAAIGALYESEVPTSQQLFEMAQRSLKTYLARDRVPDVASGPTDTAGTAEVRPDTPLVIIQATLLGVIYAHRCGDKVAAESVMGQWPTLVNLARVPDLGRPLCSDLGRAPEMMHPVQAFDGFADAGDVPMDDARMDGGLWPVEVKHEGPSDELQWRSWIRAEERKRTLFAIFVISSYLVSAHNHPPALTNSELHLDLPCREELWQAEDAPTWHVRGGSDLAPPECLPFPVALGTLLSAGLRPGQPCQPPHASALPQSFELLGASPWPGEPAATDIRPGAFGSLVLINALHNYIWETRKRHRAQEWTAQEIEVMEAQILPALAAWQAAWAGEAQGFPLERNRLWADCVPLLHLAHVRLYVGLDRSKDAFWRREDGGDGDGDGLPAGLTGWVDVAAHAEASPSTTTTASDLPDSLASLNSPGESPVTATSSPGLDAIKTPTPGHPIPGFAPSELPPSAGGAGAQRERQLRKAAFYAIASLSTSAKASLNPAGADAGELPLQFGLCAFDCAQVLSQWLSMLQRRVGRYVGVPGADGFDLGQAQHAMLLEVDDCSLLERIGQLVHEAELGFNADFPAAVAGLGLNLAAAAASGGEIGGGYGKETAYDGKVLLVTASMLRKAAVWPVMHLMAECLERQAASAGAGVAPSTSSADWISLPGL